VSEDKACALPALYVATDLEAWETEKPNFWAQDVTISGKAFRKLDADYFAWLADRMERARSACDARKISLPTMTDLHRRWSRVRGFALDQLGREVVKAAETKDGAVVSRLREYTPPVPPPRENLLPALREDQRGDCVPTGRTAGGATRTRTATRRRRRSSG
jgi:hypothetical protein